MREGYRRPYTTALTEREHTVLLGLARGMRENDLAASLYLERRSICRYARDIRIKLGVTTNAAAVAHALGRGILTWDEVCKGRTE